MGYYREDRGGLLESRLCRVKLLNTGDSCCVGKEHMLMLWGQEDTTARAAKDRGCWHFILQSNKAADLRDLNSLNWQCLLLREVSELIPKVLPSSHAYFSTPFLCLKTNMGYPGGRKRERERGKEEGGLKEGRRKSGEKRREGERERTREGEREEGRKGRGKGKGRRGSESSDLSGGSKIILVSFR